MLGAFLSLVSAATFGMNIAALRRGVLSGSVLQAIAITVPIGVPLFALGCVLFGATDDFFGMTADAWKWFALAGVVHFIAGRYANYRATRALGAAQSAPIQQLGLLVSLALAVIFLGETFTLLRAIGIVLILVGPMIVLKGRGAAEVRTSAGQRLDYVDGYIWGLICAACFGTSPLLIRYGLAENGGVAAALAGGLASYIAATVVVFLILLLPGKISHLRGMDRRNVGWFSTAGTLVCISQMLLYTALALAPVSVVMAVQRTSLIFRVLFSWMLNRDHEVLNPSILIGIGLSLIGVLAVSVSIEQIGAIVPLPEWITLLAQLNWP